MLSIANVFVSKNILMMNSKRQFICNILNCTKKSLYDLKDIKLLLFLFKILKKFIFVLLNLFLLSSFNTIKNKIYAINKNLAIILIHLNQTFFLKLIFQTSHSFVKKVFSQSVPSYAFSNPLMDEVFVLFWSTKKNLSTRYKL